MGSPITNPPLQEAIAGEYLSWQPGVFVGGLVVTSVGFAVVGEILWAEWALFISVSINGWILACGPGRPWQRLLICWLLATVPIALVSFPVSWALGFPSASFVLLRGQMMFLNTLLTALVLVGGELLWRHIPVWKGHARVTARQWAIADWMMLTGLLSVSLAVVQYLVEQIWLMDGLLEPNEQLGRWDYWWLLIGPIGWQAVLEVAKAALVVLPLSVMWSRWPVERKGFPDFLIRAAGYWAIFSSPLFLFLPTAVALEWMFLLETLVLVIALFLISTRATDAEKVRLGS